MGRRTSSPFCRRNFSRLPALARGGRRYGDDLAQGVLEPLPQTSRQPGDEKVRWRRLAEDVQADRGRLVVNLVQIGFHALDFPGREQEAIPNRDVKVSIEMGVLNLPRDRRAEFLLQGPFFESFPFFDVMVEVRQPAGQLGADRRRRQMVDQDRVRAAADGRGLAQIVDDPGVDVGHGAQEDVRPIDVGKPRGLAGQDELGPVRAEMDHGVGMERLLQPEVGGQVIVRRRRVLIVNQPGFLGLAPQRLRQEDHVAQVDAGNDKERFSPVAARRETFPAAGPIVG